MFFTFLACTQSDASTTQLICGSFATCRGQFRLRRRRAERAEALAIPARKGRNKGWPVAGGEHKIARPGRKGDRLRPQVHNQQQLELRSVRPRLVLLLAQRPGMGRATRTLQRTAGATVKQFLF